MIIDAQYYIPIYAGLASAKQKRSSPYNMIKGVTFIHYYKIIISTSTWYIIILSSYNSEGIDMKECSAYGKVISPQPAAEQSHIYESTT